MSFNIERENGSKNIKADISGIEGDNINIRRDNFINENEGFKEDLGMEFLIPEDSVKSEEVNMEEKSEDFFQNDDYGNDVNRDEEQEALRQSYEEIRNQKSSYLAQLRRLEKRGNVLSRRFTMEHSLEELKNEVFRIKKEQNIDASIDYCRQGLMFCVSTIEMADNKYNFGADLGGWSQNVMGSIDNYDSVFEELYEKYSGSIGVMPEIKLISMLAGSAFMYSLSKKMSGSKPPTRQREMSGPDIDTDELMQKLADVDIDLNDEDDDIISQSTDESIKINEEKKVIDVKKKRGRPKKNS